MTDTTEAIDPTVPDKPVVGTASTIPAIVKSVGAAALIIAGAMPTLVGLLGRHNVTEIAAYVAANSLAPVIGALTLLATVGARIWEGIKKDANLARVLRLPTVPNSVGYVKGDPGTPVAPGSTILVPPPGK